MDDSLSLVLLNHPLGIVIPLTDGVRESSVRSGNPPPYLIRRGIVNHPLGIVIPLTDGVRESSVRSGNPPPYLIRRGIVNHP